LENYNNNNKSIQNNQNNYNTQTIKKNYISENRNKILNNEISKKQNKENVKEKPTNKKDYGKIPN
jgi:hypothetical protein